MVGIELDANIIFWDLDTLLYRARVSLCQCVRCRPVAVQLLPDTVSAMVQETPPGSAICHSHTHTHISQSWNGYVVYPASGHWRI